MIYFANSSNSGASADTEGQNVSDLIAAGRLGCITSPYDERPDGRPVVYDEWDVIADNGCFSGVWTHNHWFNWLLGVPRSVRFVVAPDVFDPDGGEAHQATLDRWHHYGPLIERHGFRPAFVCQVGATPDNLPDAPVLFLGGTTEWKLGPEAWAIVDRWKTERWVHMGRVNSQRRFRTARMMGCHSVDGTYLTYGPDTNLPKLLGWIEDQEREPTLWGG